MLSLQLNFQRAVIPPAWTSSDRCLDFTEAFMLPAGLSPRRVYPNRLDHAALDDPPALPPQEPFLAGSGAGVAGWDWVASSALCCTAFHHFAT